jgi:hypothetical protein
MIDVRIVCSHDALKLAEMLMRLLEAEQHRVRLAYGRQALGELEEARGAEDAVLLIWSPNARAQTYMLEWAHNIDPRRLVEIARDASDWPSIKRVAGVIDFTSWRGQRGARAWKALTERLNDIERALGPYRLPTKTMAAMGLVGVAAVAGAVMIRTNNVEPQVEPVPLEEIAATDPGLGIGGPLSAMEPASIEEELHVRHFRQFEPIEALPHEALASVPELEQFELRDRTLLERLAAYNPLRRLDDDPT